MFKKKNILYPELSYKLSGLFFEAHNKLGKYRNEKQYADHFEVLLERENIAYKREYSAPPSFDGEKKRRNIIDFIIEDRIIVDFKAKTIITRDDYFQMQRYLVSTDKELGMIVNFRQHTIKAKRIMNTTKHQSEIDQFNIEVAKAINNRKPNSEHSEINSD